MPPTSAPIRRRWLFLTGPEGELHRLIRDSFHLGVQRTEGSKSTPGNEVIHSTRLVVVDRRGHIRGYFDGRPMDDQGQPIDEVRHIREAIAVLLEEQP